MPELPVKCPHCPRSFQTSHGLGGHTSRVHPGVSGIYSFRQEIREKRTEQRLMLKEAKQLFFERTKKNFDQHNRATLTKIKVHLISLKTEVDEAKRSEINQALDQIFNRLA